MVMDINSKQENSDDWALRHTKYISKIDRKIQKETGDKRQVNKKIIMEKSKSQMKKMIEGIGSGQTSNAVSKSNMMTIENLH